ncbi:MAG: FG-GAP-like repeat-containing protein, partial [Bacteroidota bacterium]|nr:FG-GAP-like repeat-containing protein [Bacteroidota bacterium]
SNTDWSWAPLVADFDNDGLKDIFITNGFLRDFNNLDFIKYTANAYQEARSSRRSIDYLSLIQQLPSTHIPSYIFKNENGLRFSNTTESWGLDQPSVSNGAVYADLDNDGDYDLITNNLNGQASLYRNNQNLIQKNNYIKIKLKGSQLNTAGLGAKVWITTSNDKIFQEAYFSRGFQSSVEPVFTIGLGKAEMIDEIIVLWPDGKKSIQKAISPNQVILISHADALVAEVIQPAPNDVLIHDVTESSGLEFLHQENDYIDFKAQRLLHFQVSRLGGNISKGDVNMDGNDDVFFGGALGQPGALFLGNDDGTLHRSENQPWSADSLSEDMKSLFFDADGDGDEDLYVISGGSEYLSGDPLYKDRLYLNDGTGGFIKIVNALPEVKTSGSCVVAADYDKDGDLDLFIGGRHVPGNYGITPRSYILENKSDKENIRFTDATIQHDNSIKELGMVTCAVWTDFNGDSWPDLIVAGEWMPIRLFENQKGKLVEMTNIQGLENSNGWWSSIFPVDIDNDGDMDYLLGNAGSNMQFKPTKEEPVQLFAGDFNNDGVVDPVLSYFIQGKSYPMASRDELLDQVSSLRKKFVKYEDYADATIHDIADKERVDKGVKLNAYVLQSCWLENIDGKEFKLHVLPELAQLSAINGFIYDNFKEGSKKQILAVGNFYPYKPQLGRSDASMGIILDFDKVF